MKGNWFPGAVLIGFGLYAFFQHSSYHPPFPVFTWPTILLIIGAAFLIHAYSGKDYEMILPGVILAGIGAHFHAARYFSLEANDTGIYFLIIAFGFFLLHLKTKKGLLYGWLFFTIAVFQLFYGKILDLFGRIENQIVQLSSFLPLALIAIGLYFLLFKRK
ncbi:MAG: hypothetical protein C6P37_03675 [Caldibacillus debilis]|uniref:LiaI-LiaF-like transmembrane region domain-containing protein n=2 Tax=Bacillales TaxID=1385 RepID=A0A150LVP4_9BACI|nr:DUF5668 domain-containing protein [Caldibacillus debilis]KYD16261.1 hypothetical protein B4135_0167 [Caldibacillus debilis]REJ30223.1 MAG: hypothetical protein C6P37_03675 [Caldibacillus debilis]